MNEKFVVGTALAVLIAAAGIVSAKLYEKHGSIVAKLSEKRSIKNGQYYCRFCSVGCC